MQRCRNKTNSENEHLVLSIFKEKIQQKSNVVDDISSLFQDNFMWRHYVSNDYFGRHFLYISSLVKFMSIIVLVKVDRYMQ